jgi:hypothetical protein
MCERGQVGIVFDKERRIEHCAKPAHDLEPLPVECRTSNSHPGVGIKNRRDANGDRVNMQAPLGGGCLQSGDRGRQGDEGSTLPCRWSLVLEQHRPGKVGQHSVARRPTKIDRQD